jgi:hypothetical protein
MISNQDLRIGNLYYIAGTKSMVKYQLRNVEIRCNSEGEILNFDPIPITEQYFKLTVLKRIKDFNYSKIVNNDTLPPFYFKVQGIEATDNFWYRLILKGETIKVIKYFHQLQNIYFDIAGKELIQPQTGV